MPSFDKETLAQWRADAIEEALTARKPTENQWELLDEAEREEVRRARGLAAQLAEARSTIVRIRRKRHNANRRKVP